MNTDFLQLFSEGESAESAAEGTVAEGSAEGEFDALIKGKYRDEYHRRVQSVIDKRFSKMKAMEGTLKSVEPLLERISQDFPQLEKSDTEGIVRAYLEKSQAHTAAGNNKRSSAFIEALEGRMKMKAAENMKTSILNDARSLREIYPSFDLQGELSSTPDFRRLLTAGVPLRQAYEVTHLESIMATGMKYAAMKASRDTAEGMLRAPRTPENSLSQRASSTRHRSVDSLTEKDIRDILTAVGNGEKVVF